MRSLPHDPARRIPGQPVEDRSAVLVRVRPSAAAERSLRMTLRRDEDAPSLPLDGLLSRFPGVHGEPLFARVPRQESPQRTLQWVLPGDGWSPTPASDATNILTIPPGM